MCDPYRGPGFGGHAWAVCSLRKRPGQLGLPLPQPVRARAAVCGRDEDQRRSGSERRRRRLLPVQQPLAGLGDVDRSAILQPMDRPGRGDVPGVLGGRTRHGATGLAGRHVQLPRAAAGIPHLRDRAPPPPIPVVSRIPRGGRVFFAHQGVWGSLLRALRRVGARGAAVEGTVLARGGSAGSRRAGFAGRMPSGVEPSGGRMVHGALGGQSLVPLRRRRVGCAILLRALVPVLLHALAGGAGDRGAGAVGAPPWQCSHAVCWAA